MFDPILKQSIQRWEYEGGLLIPSNRGNDLRRIDRNKNFRSWNEVNRDAHGGEVERLKAQ